MTVFWRRRRDEAGDREVAELAALADGSLSEDRRGALEERVAASPELAARLAEQQRAVAIAQRAAGVTAPEGLRARIEARRRAPAGRAPRRVVLAGATVVAVAGAVALGLIVSRSSTSAEQFRAALRAPSSAPGATGEATLTKTSSGWKVELHASGLPRLDRGRFYEAWLRNGAGVLVPIGTFNDGRNVTLWAGVSPKEFRTLTVTREEADGDQASSGQKVLVGTAGRSG